MVGGKIGVQGGFMGKGIAAGASEIPENLGGRQFIGLPGNDGLDLVFGGRENGGLAPNLGNFGRNGIHAGLDFKGRNSSQVAGFVAALDFDPVGLAGFQVGNDGGMFGNLLLLADVLGFVGILVSVADVGVNGNIGYPG